MPPALRKDRFWSQLVWPLLWPFLVAQLLLVLLCLVVGLFLWLGTPEPTSWAASGWLLVALLLGTSLTTAAFLLQLRHRLQAYQLELDGGLAQLERRAEGLAQAVPPWLERPGVVEVGDAPPAVRLANLEERLSRLQADWEAGPSQAALLASASRPGLLLHRGRIVAVNRAMESLLGEAEHSLCGQDSSVWLHAGGSSEPDMVQVLDADGKWRHLLVERTAAREYELIWLDVPRDDPSRLDDLVSALDRAREDSRLKTHYLALLQRELEPLLNGMGRELASALGRVEERRLAELRERMADVKLLVESLVGASHALPSGQDTPPTATQSVLRVLIVDDGPVNRMLASQVLEGQGVAVDSVASGREALERRQRYPYDLVFMDIFMPDMDGVETSRRWRELEAGDPARRRSVLVALTANATVDDRRRFSEAGMDDYLAKPYRPRALLDLLRVWRPDAFEEAQPS